MTRRTFLDLATLVFFWGASSTCMAQSFDDIDMSDLSLRDIDATIAEIEHSLELITFASEASQSSAQTAPVTTDTDAAVVPVSTRRRGNPLCFATNPQFLFTPLDVDAHFESIEASLTQATKRVASVVTLREALGDDACQGAVKLLLEEAAAHLAQVSRPELSDMAYHFEECWPDDGLNEPDGSELNVDARFARARKALSMFRRTEYQYSEARKGCQ